MGNEEEEMTKDEEISLAEEEKIIWKTFESKEENTGETSTKEETKNEKESETGKINLTQMKYQNDLLLF